MWDSARIKQVAFELLRAKRVSVEGLVTPIVISHLRLKTRQRLTG